MATLEGVARKELEVKHGSNATYSRHKCRCDLCREARAEYVRSQKEKKKKALAKIPVHGSTQRYNAYKCRCEECVGAMRDYRYFLKVRKGQVTVQPRPGSRITKEQLDRALYHLQDGCSYAEAARTVGMGQQTLMGYFPGYEKQGRLNMVEINSKPELKALHDEIWNMKLP